MSLPFALSDVRRVTFFKRDELTTDLIYCEVEADDEGVLKSWTCHEEDAGWPEWVGSLQTLPGFDSDWFSKVSQPPFASSSLVAFPRPVA